MRIIREYILGEFLKPLIACFVLFISLSWIIDLFDHLDEVVKAKVPMFVLCDYYFSMTPFIFVNISPIIIILATIFTLSTLNRHNEIMAIKAIGVNLWSIIWIFLGFGILMSALSFGVNELIKPDSYLHSISLKEQYFKPAANQEKNHIMNDLTLYGSKNRIFIINSYDTKRQQMSNITISENNNKNQLSRQLVAKKAQWVEGFWIFYDCIITEYENGKAKSEAEHFEERVEFIDEKPRDFARSDLQPDLMSYWQLKKYIRRLKASGFKAHKEMVIFYNKLAFPLANFIIIFFAVPFTLTRARSGNLFLGIALSIIISFSYWGSNALCLSLGKIGVLSPLLSAWLTNIIFLFIGIWLIESVKK
ncbi:MAG: LPS export ABC transporter permease LptG [Candidatus Omnitrophica bacterium]|nr:LPS export ABC transporter permease LptG [Candidatus Omnitrophota bacterium]